MNCLDYRRQLGADPRRESPEMQAHRRGCAGCSAHHARALGFELALKRALVVPVPDGLAERILLSQTTAERGQRTRHRHRLRWLAAAVLLVAALGAGIYQLRLLSPLPQQLVAHIEHEPEAFLTQAALPQAEALKPFQQRGVRLAGVLPAGISYAQPCPVGMIGAVHLVMSRPDGAVTVFFLPGHEERRGDYRSGNLRVRAVPMAAGTLALVAANAAPFDALEADWRRSLEGGRDVAAGAP
jgi:Protein of unknown function (DUF3379)